MKKYFNFKTFFHRYFIQTNSFKNLFKISMNLWLCIVTTVLKHATGVISKQNMAGQHDQ